MDFYFGLVCTSLLSLANARTTAVIPTAYPEFDNCGFNLNATCDDHMELFADGNLLATSDDWKNTSVVYIPPNTGEIEIHCTDRWILGGILASSDNGLITNNAWNCSSDNRTTWNPAHELGANGVTAGNISSAAMWIWTDRPTWKHTIAQRHTTAICTIKLPTNSVCGTPTPTTTPTTTTPCNRCVPCLFSGTTPPPTQSPTPTPGFNLNATCNNKMELFVDGNLLATSDNWRDTLKVHIPGNTENIEIHCMDSCWLIEGIISSSDNGLITDNSWNCSSDNGITWSPAYEIVPNGLSVPDISSNAKWISTGQNTWRDEGKVICKVTLDIQPELTTPMPTDCLYTDKYVECPDFKNQCTTGNFVDCMNRECAKTCKCHWSPWSPWSVCSATCGIAVKSRKRTCLQHPCPPGPTEEAISCHPPSCGPYIQQKCFLEDTNITFLDLGRNHMHQDQPPVWKIAENGRSLTETKNTRPSIGLSNLGDITEPVSFSGRVFSASGDDDVIGMVFGFWNEANFFVIASARQHPGPTNWYVARLHATCTPGLSCATTTTISDAIWDPPSHPKDITLLATGNTPWQHGKEYNFTVCFNPSKLLLSVTVTNENEAEPILETGIISAKTNDSEVDEVSRKGGFLGVYVDSQAQTTWDYLVCQDCNLIDPPPSKDSIYFIAGGISSERDIELYDPTMSNLSCSIIPPPPNKKWYYHTTFYYNNTIYLYGGVNTASTCISYNINAKEWKTHTLTTSRKDGHSSTILKKRIYIIGGRDSSNNYVGAESTPLPLTDRPVLTPVSNLDYKVWYHCTTKVDEDTLVVTGGSYRESLNKFLSSVIEYNTNNHTTTSLPSMEQPRCYHGCAVVEMDNTKSIIVAGGYNRVDKHLKTTEMLQIGGSSWKLLGDLNVARRGHSIAVTQRGVMAMGGHDGSGFLSSVELLDWSAKSWRIVEPSLSKSRYVFGGAVEIPASMFDCRGTTTIKTTTTTTATTSTTTITTIRGSGFEGCVNNWCLQNGTNEQYTRCEETRDGGDTCVNPHIKYGSTEGGIPIKHSSNDYNTWCTQIFREKRTGSITTGTRDCSAPKGKLFWCSNYDENGPKWCDWRDGYWKDSTLDKHIQCSTAIIALTCKKGQRQQQRNFPGKRQHNFPKLPELEGSTIPRLLKQPERESSNMPSSKKLTILSLPEHLEQEAQKIPSLQKQPNLGVSKEASSPEPREQSGMKLEFQLKGMTGMEKVKISVDGNEEEFDLTTKWRLFSYPRPSSGSFSVEFLNDIGYTDVFIRGHESQVTDLLPNFPANKFLGCGIENEDEKCGILRKGTLMWNGKYTYTLKG